MKKKEDKTGDDKSLKAQQKNKQLWIALACVPFALVVVLALYGHITDWLDTMRFKGGKEESQPSAAITIQNERYRLTEDSIRMLLQQDSIRTAILNELQDTAYEDDIDIDDADEDEDEDSEETNEIVKSESKAAAKGPKAEKQMLVHDSNGKVITVVVEPGQSLQTIAQQLFHHSAFWGYIYDVNRDQLMKPNDIVAGMELNVPNKKYFNIVIGNDASIKKAKQHSNDIMYQAYQ